MSADFNQAFADTLLGRGDQDVLSHLANPDHASRLSVYRNNVTRAAIEALRAAYPAVNRIAGANFFSPMARQYWLEHPPGDAPLYLYGAFFERHVAAYDPARALPYLPSIARLDRAWLQAHHAADTAVLSPADLTRMDVDSLPDLKPGLAASVHLLRLDHAAHSVWLANRQDADLEDMKIGDGPEHVLVWRHRGTVHSSSIPIQHFTFLVHIANGDSLADAIDAAGPGSIDTAQFFSHGLTSGLFAAKRQHETI